MSDKYLPPHKRILLNQKDFYHDTITNNSQGEKRDFDYSKFNNKICSDYKIPIKIKEIIIPELIPPPLVYKPSYKMNKM